MNIAIIGLGNIGSFLYKYLHQNKKILQKKNNCNFEVLFVSAKNKTKNRNIRIKKKQWLNNYLDATKIKNIDIVVELIGGAEGPAKKLVFNALKNKKQLRGLKWPKCESKRAPHAAASALTGPL